MAIPQADDFRAESEALFDLLKPVEDGRFGTPTGFKGWTLDAILTHLYFWKQMAGFQLTNEATLHGRMRDAASAAGGMRAFEAKYCANREGQALLAAWHEDMHATADQFAKADPKQRLKWAGPDMSARSSITARLMETWAHGQAIYDALGVARQDGDRIRNIVVLGVNTFGWTFRNRKQDVPEPMPHLVLTAPSGETWTHGEPSKTECIEGSATAFCQVVTQTRNIADTDLKVTGPIANAWMSIAQCFAGPPETPPAAGMRRMRETI
ncbi:MAG: TIGR03084 family metal-binding protein [Pseudomonadota bacterium]